MHAGNGCVHRIDVGEHAYAQVLADDLTGNGKLDLLLATMNGVLYCLETSTPAAPAEQARTGAAMRAWRSQAQGHNVFQQRENWQGVAILSPEPAAGRGGDVAPSGPRQLSGESFTLEFEILDARRKPSTRVHAVSLRLGRSRLLFNATYRTPAPEPGTPAAMRYRVEVPCPHERLVNAVLTLTMVNEHGQHFEDVLAVSLHEGFEHALKWVALLPFAAATLAVAAGAVAQSAPLPRFAP